MIPSSQPTECRYTQITFTIWNIKHALFFDAFIEVFKQVFMFLSAMLI